jgi:hypothetical protein
MEEFALNVIPADFSKERASPSGTSESFSMGTSMISHVLTFASLF